MPDSPRGLIFNVQRFSLHDGPGIRTTVFFKGCPLRCRWCQNPESFRREPEIAFAADRCRDTGDCLSACSRNALRPGENRIARENCDACGLCVPACAYGAFRVIGRSVSVEELADEVSRDIPFYRASGGGVTLSGGEPTLQMEFVKAFARRGHELGISVGLQTCGLFRWPDFEPVFDFIHFDLKAIDSARHRDLTGGDNRAILENARRLVSAGVPVVFRSVAVPGLTDDEANLKDIAAFLRESGISSLRLLRYHAMGEVKLERMVGRLLNNLQAVERANTRLHPTPLASMLLRGCLESGRDATAGGARYNGSGIQGVGVVEVGDSFVAIETVVFRDRRATMADVVRACRAGFRGYDALRSRLRNAPKYGNDGRLVLRR